MNSFKALKLQFSNLLSQRRLHTTTHHLIAKSLINQIKSHGIYKNIQEAEFKVYSQFGGDGIIQYLIQHVKLKENERRFIEFGVENYLDSSTRFVLVNNNWHGLVIDSNEENISFIKNDEIYWKHDLSAVCEFITCENIETIIAKYNFQKNIGLLSIDIDGNDYWVWNEIKQVSPVIVVIEYNSIFGNKYTVTVPYNSGFVTSTAHYSHLYWGASLKALFDLAKRKGYVFVGTESAGNNAYFVREDRVGKIPIKTMKDGYTASIYRESRDTDGKLNFLNQSEKINEIKHLSVYNARTKQLLKIQELYKIQHPAS